MARVLLSETKDWVLEDKDQDLRGWEVRDAKGQRIGAVGDMIVDTDRLRIDTVVLEDGATFRADDVHLADGVVYVDSYGAPSHARPYTGGHGVRMAETVPHPGPAASGPQGGVFADDEDAFRRHYSDAYGDLDYTDYAPAYRFGYDMAYDDRYADRDFEAVEAELRAGYYRRHGYPMSDNLVWHRVSDAVRHAFTTARTRR